MESKHKKQVSELKCHYDKILLQNEEELYKLKKFKKDSDYITGQIVYDAEVKHKRELEQRSKKNKKELSQTKTDLQKQHLREIEKMEKKHNRALQKASDLVDRLRREKKNSQNVTTNK